MTPAGPRSSLIAIRHAPPLDPTICYGRFEPPLTLEAGQTGRRILRGLGGVVPEVVWSSPAPRCREPALWIADQGDAECVIDERLHELDFGVWEGRPWSRIEAEDPERFACWMEAWLETGPPGGESAEVLERRVQSWWHSLDLRRTHLLVAHAGVVRALRVLAGKSDWCDAMRTDIPALVPLTFPLPPAR